MEQKTELDELYQTKLESTIFKLEVKRKAIVKAFCICSALTIGISSLAYFLLPSFNILIGLLLLLTGFGYTYFSYGNKKGELTKDFKEKIIQPLSLLVNGELTYSPEKGIAEMEFIQSSLVNRCPNIFKSEDLFEGKIGATDFYFSEVDAKKKTKDSDGHTTTESLFKGLLFVANFNKRTLSDVVVQYNFFGNKLGWLGNAIIGTSVRDDLHEIKLEDVEFNKKFIVYGSDEVESRYILSPSLMQRLKDFQAKGIFFSISFIENKVFIGVYQNTNLFEPRIFRSITNKEEITLFTHYLQLLTDVVEDLNMNNRIYHV